MNARILKKLTKKAEPFIIALGLVNGQRRVVVTDGVDEQVESNFWGDWRTPQCKGTVGYGCMSGYEEPEWEDRDCYSTLYSNVMDHFFDWGKCDGERMPECEWPDNFTRSPSNIFKIAHFLVLHYESQPIRHFSSRNTPDISELISVLRT